MLRAFTEGSAYVGLVMCLAGYAVGLWVQRRVRHPLAHPLVIAIALNVAAMALLGIAPETFDASASKLSFLLGPATVALAVPLHRQMQLLRRNAAAVLAGVLAGSVSAVLGVLALAALLGTDAQVLAAMLPKSVTTAIAMPLAEQLGGIPAMTMVCTCITGIMGATLCPLVFRWFRVTDEVAMGIAIGTAAHAVGTAQAVQRSEVQGAMSGLAIVVAGLTTTGLLWLYALV